MAGSHTPTPEHHTSVDSSQLTLISTLDRGLRAPLAGRVDNGHFAAFAEHMREGLLAASTGVRLDVLAETDARRSGTAPSQAAVTLGGRRVPMRRPRVRDRRR